MSIEQAFVSAVAYVLGVLCLAVACFDLEWFFRLPKAQWAQGRWGRRGARLAFGVLGVLLILVGTYIALSDHNGPSRKNNARTTPMGRTSVNRPAIK